MAVDAILTVMGGEEDGRTYNLSKDTTLIGRGVGADVQVDDPGVSLIHACIRARRDGYWIQDIGSFNRTFVNGQKIGFEPHRLEKFDRIQVRGRNYAQLEFSKPYDGTDIPDEALWWVEGVTRSDAQPRPEQGNEAGSDES